MCLKCLWWNCVLALLVDVCLTSLCCLLQCNTEVLLLEVLVAELLEKQALVRDVLEVLKLVLLAEVLEV